MKRRFITSLAAGTLMAAMLPGMAAAQTDGQGLVQFASNLTCHTAEGLEPSMPTCGVDENGVLTMTNPQERVGSFDGIQVLDLTVELDTTDGTFAATGTSLFAGTVAGCGSGTVYFDWAATGATNADGVPEFITNSYTSVPGGTLAVTATIDETPAESPNGDGTAFIPYTTTYSCDAAA